MPGTPVPRPGTNRPPQAALTAAAAAAAARRRDIKLRLAHTTGTDLHALFTGYAQTHPDMRTMTIGSLLAALPGIGETTKGRILSDLGIPADRPAWQLGVIQGAELAHRLDNRNPKGPRP